MDYIQGLSLASFCTKTHEFTSNISHIIKKTGCFAVGFFGDFLLLPGAGALAVVAKCYKSNFDPTIIKKEQTPVLLIHGNGFNEIQWVFGRAFLSKQKNCGSVFSLNLDGIVSNEPNNGIDHYADKVRNKVLEIQKLTGRNDITLVGHSMGGLVAAHFAENLGSKDNIAVKKIITISTPWYGSPLLNKLTEITRRFFPSLFQAPKRFKEMRDEDQFLTNLREKVSRSAIPYFTVYSHGDAVVPGESGKLHGKSERVYTCHGHYTPMISPSIWKQVQAWLQEDSAV